MGQRVKRAQGVSIAAQCDTDMLDAHCANVGPATDSRPAVPTDSCSARTAIPRVVVEAQVAEAQVAEVDAQGLDQTVHAAKEDMKESGKEEEGERGSSWTGARKVVLTGDICEELGASWHGESASQCTEVSGDASSSRAVRTELEGQDDVDIVDECASSPGSEVLQGSIVGERTSAEGCELANVDNEAGRAGNSQGEAGGESPSSVVSEGCGRDIGVVKGGEERCRSKGEHPIAHGIGCKRGRSDGEDMGMLLDARS